MTKEAILAMYPNAKHMTRENYQELLRENLERHHAKQEEEMKKAEQERAEQERAERETE